MKIGFIGFGNMATAIAKGMLKNGFALARDIIAYDPLSDKIGAVSSEIRAAKDAAEVVREAKYVFLCVKPQMLQEAADSMKNAIGESTLFVSILAGCSCERLQKALQTDRPILRVMPNTPLMVGVGCTAVCERPDGMEQDDYDYLFSVFSSMGHAFALPESLFCEIIPVNGSSPALIYTLAKYVAEDASRNGIDYNEALKAFAHTLIGSAQMILQSGKPVDELTAAVCSKGGTTLAMLDALNGGGLADLLTAGYDACVKRAYELGKQA